MAILTGKYDPNAEASQDIGKLPSGEYIAQVIDSDMKPTNDNTGEYLELTYEVLDGPCKGRKHWERLNLVNRNETTVRIANEQWAAVRVAAGFDLSYNVRDSQEVHYKPHVIRVEFNAAGSKKKNGQTRERDEANIKAWKKLDGAAPVQTNTPTQPASPTGSNPPWKRNAA